MITSITHNSQGEPEITLKCDPEKMTGVVNGCLWFGMTDGQPVFLPRYKPLPEPQEDQGILPFWNSVGIRKVWEIDQGAYFSPTFELQHLCGYHWTPENYRLQSARVESYGFECLRSKRGKDGKYWEVWRLHGYWSAKGDLRDYIHDAVDKIESNQDKVQAVVSWLCQHCSFGSLDVTCQRAAMCVD